MSSSTYSNLENCNNSLSESIQLLRNSSELLRETTKDSLRLKQVLTSTRTYGLVPKLDVEDAKENYRNTITPQIMKHYVKIQNEVNKLEHKRNNLSSTLTNLREKLKRYKSNDQEINFEQLLKDARYDEFKVRKLRDLRAHKLRLKYSLNSRLS
ncbi:SPC19 [Candida pseudojiufengensis]|uniref:SPC19 n=1 Tax=Candida pseudojiufengensis TaxID=497109 RepID=UPI0022245AC2|nr:SPC19 [Candida pseudojiufengensis]KAI5961196.1 SPC19 [Candida pseudojiufengensis]